MKKLHNVGFAQGISGLLLISSLAGCATTSVDEQQTSAKQQGNYATHTVTQAQTITTNKTALTLEQIMADPDWIGNVPTSAYWGLNSQQVYFLRKRQGSPLQDLWQLVPEANAAPAQVALQDIHKYRHQNAVYNLDRSKAAWIYANNLLVQDMATGELTQLTRDNQARKNVRFLLDGRISFQIDDAFYAVNINTSVTEMMVSWQFADSPKANQKAKDYVSREQLDLIQTVVQIRSERQQNFDYRQQLQALNPGTSDKPFYLPEAHKTVEASLSPNGRWLILSINREVKSRSDSDLMPNYVGEDGRIENREVRRRVADAKEVNQQLWLFDLETGKKHSLSYQSLPGFDEDVLASVKRENQALHGIDYEDNPLPREIGLMQDWHWSQSPIQWHNSGTQVAIMLEAWDNKDRWIASVNFEQAELVSQHRLHDDAWINYKFNSFGWLNKTESLYFLSEQSGYAHLYLKPVNGQSTALTQGRFEVDEVTLTDDDQFIYFQANQTHPGIYEIYRVNLQTGEQEQLTQLNGYSDYTLSPDGGSLLVTHSKLAKPPELYVKTLGTQQDPVKITQSTSEQFNQIGWAVPQVVAIPSSHTEQPIYARLYLPKDYQVGTNKAVVFNHGAGYLQNAHLGWSGYFREFMFHSLLVQQGYVVLDMDYRASAGYGRDWRTAIYRQMGTPEVQDLQDGVNWLAENANVDSAKVGTYGGSYGGFLTFMAMFTQPDLFAAGAALRPVTDWAHYNTPYTSNILNTPDLDPIAYRKSSPIYFAEGLQKPLLINAPMLDSNVFFQDVVRLVQRLIELEKQDFETAIYPMEGHGFKYPSSWLDEYRRIFKLFEDNL